VNGGLTREKLKLVFLVSLEKGRRSQVCRNDSKFGGSIDINSDCLKSLGAQNYQNAALRLSMLDRCPQSVRLTHGTI
jgi:hypothetical protein